MEPGDMNGEAWEDYGCEETGESYTDYVTRNYFDYDGEEWDRLSEKRKNRLRKLYQERKTPTNKR